MVSTETNTLIMTSRKLTAYSPSMVKPLLISRTASLIGPFCSTMSLYKK